MNTCWRQRLIGCIVLILCVLPFELSSSAVVHSITVAGNTAVPREDILSWISLRPTALFTTELLEQDLTRIAAGYRQRGFFNATVRASGVRYTPDSSSVDVSLDVVEGKQTLLEAVHISGAHVLQPQEILADFTTRPGEPLDQASLERDIDALLARYEQLGYPFARCVLAGVNVRPDSLEDHLTVELTVDEGSLVRIDEVTVEGNSETNTNVILREARLSVGEVYQPARVRTVKDRLTRLNIFSSVAEPELYLRGGHGGLLLRVQEGNTNTFDGIVGYAPGGTGQQGAFTGYAAVAMRNLFGTGRKLQLRWQKEDRASQELAVRYVEPWIFGAPVNMEGGFQQRRQDSAYVQESGDLKAELMLSNTLAASLFVRTESVIPSADLGVQRVERSATTSVGAELLYDTRNDPYSPTGGARYQIDYAYGRRNATLYAVNAQESTPIQRLTLDLDAFVPTFTRQVLALGLHGREVKGRRLTETEMFRFGGARSLRGYRENEFLGSRVVWTSTEYRLLLARRSFLMSFIDLGYYVRPEDQLLGVEKTEAFKYGYGLGIGLDTALGNMSVSFALGKGDSFGQGKIHIGLVNEF